MGISNRETKELNKLKVKATSVNLNEHEKKRVEQLESKLLGETSYIAKKPTDKYRLGEFQPEGKQKLVVSEMERYPVVMVQGASGVGKTTCVVWKALTMLGTKYKKIVFIKNPTEAGDDQIGFLTGGESSKLEPHFESMRNVFYKFMSKEKLESDEKNGNIVFTIPNFMLGATVEDAVYILDECQTYSPNTIKLLMERVSDSCLVVCLGDKNQVYSVKKRKDGFSDLIERVCNRDEDGALYSVEPLFSYIDIPPSENRRGKVSQRVTELYGS